MAESYGFQYELVQYKWPRWLHQQTEKQRIIWGYKILFLDVLFPLAVDKIIFVDADQVRIKLKRNRKEPCKCVCLKVRDSSMNQSQRRCENWMGTPPKCRQSSPYLTMFSLALTDSSC